MSIPASRSVPIKPPTSSLPSTLPVAYEAVIDVLLFSPINPPAPVPVPTTVAVENALLTFPKNVLPISPPTCSIPCILPCDDTKVISDLVEKPINPPTFSVPSTSPIK